MRSFEAELLRHIRALRRYAIVLTRNPDEADDLVQETLRRVLDYRPDEANVRNWRSYLFRTLHNVLADQSYRLSRTNGIISIDDVDIPILACTPTQEELLASHMLSRAVETLPDEQKHVLLLVGLRGFSYREGADILDISVGTVMSRLNRARATLRRALYSNDATDLRGAKWPAKGAMD